MHLRILVAILQDGDEFLYLHDVTTAKRDGILGEN
jgi:hypothetical protein